MNTLIKSGLMFALLGSSLAHAANDVDCYVEISNVYISFNETTKNINLGKRYEYYIIEINKLNKTGYFKNLRITQQHSQVRKPINTSYGPKGFLEVTFNFNLEFETNYNAYTELTKFNADTLDISVQSKKTDYCV